jgi:Na+-translocating ferredoxin:NAD+ oxidoreductase RnfA subunit
MPSIVKWAVWGFGIAVSFVWIIQVLALWRHRNAAHWLADLPDSLRGSAWPWLAVIFFGA